MNLSMAYIAEKISTVVWVSKSHITALIDVKFINDTLCRTAFTDLNLYCIKWALALFVLVSFSGYVCYIKLNTKLSSPR